MAAWLLIIVFFLENGFKATATDSLPGNSSFLPVLFRVPDFDHSPTRFLAKNDMREFLSYFLSMSLPHQCYVLFDSTYEDIDVMLHMSFERGAECTLMKINDEEQLQPLYEMLLTPLSMTNIARRHFFTFCNALNIERIFQVVLTKNLENPNFWWVVFTEKANVVDKIQRILREGSQVLLVQKQSSRSLNFFTTDVDRNNTVRFVEVGRWGVSAGRPWHTLAPEVFMQLTDLYSDFRGRQLLVKANNNPPFHGLKELEDGTVLPDSGIDVSVVDALSKTLNFTWRVEKPHDGKWGGPLPDGTVSGMIGEVARREAHMAICEITITATRETVIDFSSPYYFESLTIIGLAPPEKNRAFAILSPFTLVVWLCITFATLVIGPLLTVETWIMRTYLNDHLEGFNLNNFTFNMFRCLVVQTNLLESKYWPHRFICIFWYLFCFYVAALYSGTLTAVLVTPAFEKPIDQLTDIPKAVKQEGYSIGVIGDTAFEYIFKEAKEGIYKDIWPLFNHKDRSKSFFNLPDEGFQMLLKGNFLFLNPQMNSKIRAIKVGIKKFHFSKQAFYPQGYGIACNSGSPYRLKFNQLLLHMMEGGLIKKWADREVTKVAGKGNNEGERDSGPTVVSLKHLQAAFFLLALGFAFGAVVLVLENVFFRIQPLITYINPVAFQKVSSNNK